MLFDVLGFSSLERANTIKKQHKRVANEILLFIGCLVNLRLVSKILEIRHHLLRHSFLRVSNECITLLLIFIKQDHSYAKIFRL